MGRGWVTLCVTLALASTPACGGGQTTPSATLASAPTTQRTTTTLSVEHEVEAAYLKSWDVYAAAVKTFDTSKLADVYVGRALEIVLKDVADLQRDGTPVRVAVDHDYKIRAIGSDAFEVVDRYMNHSVLLDGKTMDSIEPDPNKLLTDIYTLQRHEGAWKVLSIDRA